MQQNEQHEEPAVVVFGGGSGLNTLLSGLKHRTGRLTAVVTVGDDGGSSGRIRKEFDVPPPGDIRNCLLALATAEPLMGELFNYRFEESDLVGHNFGNLLITALTKITGSFLTAVETANKILAVRGRVLPATHRKVTLVAHHPDGSKSTGEMSIVRSGKPIDRIEARPRPGPLRDEVRRAIEEADVLVFGPGSLYTSIVPHVLVEGFADCVAGARAARVFVCNIMTQPGETGGYGVARHVEQFLRHAGRDCLTHVLVNSGVIPAEALSRYRAEGAEPVTDDADALRGIRVVRGEFAVLRNTVRHDATRLADAIVGLVQPRFHG